MIIPTIITGRYLSPTVAVFARTATAEKKLGAVFSYTITHDIMLAHTITHDITLNLFDKVAREPKVPRTAQWNSETNAEGARGNGENEINITINPLGSTQQNTHPGGGGTAVSAVR